MAINRSKKAQSGVVPPDEFTLRGAAASLDAAIQIAKERNGYLEKMRAALLSNDDVQLKLYARKLCGLPPESAPALPPKLKGKHWQRKISNA